MNFVLFRWWKRNNLENNRTIEWDTMETFLTIESIVFTKEYI